LEDVDTEYKVEGNIIKKSLEVDVI